MFCRMATPFSSLRACHPMKRSGRARMRALHALRRSRVGFWDLEFGSWKLVLGISLPLMVLDLVQSLQQLAGGFETIFRVFRQHLQKNGIKEPRHERV